jgi:hypothetical protein
MSDGSRTVRSEHLLGHQSPVASRTQQGDLVGRVYRAGHLVCGWVQVTIRDDGRLGLTREERRVVGVRFHEPLDDGLRSELREMLRRRGQAARRVAERVDPIEVVVDEPGSGYQRIVGCVQPPQVRHGALRDIEFALRGIEARR